MAGFALPLCKTRRAETNKTFALDDPAERQRYFAYKAGKEIEKLRSYLQEGTFVGFLLGPKNSGKGTYSKLFAEAVGEERVRHISVGDIVRSVHRDFEDAEKKQELMTFLSERYRGFVPLPEAIDAFLGRSTKTLLPTEFILALVEREISRLPHAAIFIDGFPRSLDQVSYSLYFRSLMGYRDDPDFFVFIDVPENIIHERMQNRVVCPICQTPRNLKLLKTKEVKYNERTGVFSLLCDTKECNKAEMVAKEGDELGIEAIRERIEVDKTVMRTLLTLEGVPKVFLRNAVPISLASEYIDDYEITPSYRYKRGVDKDVRVIQEPWVVNDDEGVPSYSLLPAPIAVSLIRQIAGVLGLS